MCDTSFSVDVYLNGSEAPEVMQTLAGATATCTCARTLVVPFDDPAQGLDWHDPTISYEGDVPDMPNTQGVMR